MAVTDTVFTTDHIGMVGIGAVGAIHIIIITHPIGA